MKPRKHTTLQHGMALVAVLWIVAALGVMIGSISTAVRDATRMASAVRNGVTGQGFGEAAINLALQQMAENPARIDRLTVFDATFQGVQIPVSIVPATGLINLNSAPEPLLAALFTVAGGLDPTSAAALAQATVAVRNEKDAAGRAVGFEVPEDLMRVPNVPYIVYANISGLTTASRRAGGKVNALSAPEAVLAVLANGNSAIAARISTSRDRGGIGTDTTALEAAWVDNSVSRTFRLTADVPLADGRVQVSQTVEFTAAGTGELPWRILQNNRVFATATAPAPASAPPAVPAN